jgi:hypothetical protein
MNKSIICATFLLLSLVNGQSFIGLADPNSDVCELLQGLYQQVGLSSPTVICACFDEATSQNLLNLIGEVLQQAASGSISALTQIIAEIEAFNATIPAQVQQCLQGSGPQAAIVQAAQAYGIYGLTQAQIESKVETYVLFHLAAFKAQVTQTQTDFNAGNYVQAGVDSGVLVQKIFPSSSMKIVSDPQGDVCQLLDGVWEQANLADTTVICSCFDETSSQNLLNLIQEILQQASSGSVSALTKIIAEIEAFNASLPAAVTQCLQGSGPQAALVQAEQAYNIYGLTQAQIESKIETYVVFHLSAVVAAVTKTLNDFNAGNYDQAGHDAGALAQQIFPSSSMKIVGDPQGNVCQLLDGVWEQANLADTTVICSCFDETTSQNLLTLIGTILQQASSGSISALAQIIKEIEAFQATVPAAVTQCLQGSGPQAAEVQAEQAYNIYGLTAAQIESKIESYVVFHLAAAVAAIKQTQTDFNAGNYDQAGHDAGKLAQQVFPSSLTDANGDTCDLITGLYAAAKLSAPTLLCSCFDDATSQSLLALIGTCLSEAASGNISALTKITAQITAFEATIPPAVTQCMSQPDELALIVQGEQAFHIYGKTQDQINSVVETYVLFHLTAVTSAVKTAQTAFNAGQFSAAGQDAGALVLKIFPSMAEASA